MPTGRTCGNCQHFTRIKTFEGKRSGICDIFDYTCNVDSTYAVKCKKYKKLKFNKPTTTDIN